MLSVSLLKLATIALSTFSSANALVPQPQTGVDSVTTAGSVNISTISFLNPSSFFVNIDSTLSHDVVMAGQRLDRTLTSLLPYYLSPLQGGELPLTPGSGSTLTEIRVTLAKGKTSGSIAEEAVKPIEQRDESYELYVPASGCVRLSAKTALGLLRGLTTFEQMFYLCPTGDKRCDGYVFSVTGAVTIKDAPRFPWRGLMLDTARNYFSISAIQRTLEAMSLVKLNTFHWHIVDSQSYPLSLKAYPELAGKGSYSPLMRYTEAEVQNVIGSAAALGIDVVLELDVPAHSAAIGASHPELLACLAKTPWPTYANEPPAGQLRLNAAALNFTRGVFQALMPNLQSKYVHQGGDEPNAACYTEDNVTQSDLAARGLTLPKAYSNFVGGIQNTIANANKTSVGWHDIIVPPLEQGSTAGAPINSAMDISKDTIIIPWNGSYVKPVLSKGNRIIHGSSENFYLDCGSGNWIPHNGNDQVIVATRMTWCDPTKSWDQIYTFDPFLKGIVTPDQYSQVLGGQVFLWTEGTSESGMDGRIWPRAAAAAELWWTGAEPGSYPMNAIAALPRMNDIDYRLRAKGIGSMAIQPLYCAMRPGACAWSLS